MHFFKENLLVFKKVFIPLLCLMIFSSALEQYLNSLLESSMGDPNGAQNTVYFLGFISVTTSILFPGIIITTVLYALTSLKGWPITLGSFLKRNLNQVYIEMMRSWGKTLFWSLFLVIPGVIKFIQFTFVPFVVSSNLREYEEGELDALKTSAKIVNRRWISIVGVLIVFYLLLPLVLTSLFSAYRILWQTPLLSLGLSILDTYLLILSTHILYNIFRNEVAHVTHV